MADRQDELAPRLHSVAIRLLRRLRAEDRHAGLSPARLSVLSVLVYGGPHTITSLAEAEQLRRPTISRLVKEMESENLVRRQPDSMDARAQWIHPTTRGRRLLGKARQQRIRRLNVLLDRIPETERNVLDGAVEILERIVGPRR